MKGLDYPSERYVRFYCRDTASWMVLGWEAQALYPQIRRKCDRAGVLDLGDELKGEALAAMLPKWPPEMVERGLEQLIAKGWVEHVDRLNWLYLADFEDSESAKMTSAQRSREHRRKLAAEGRIVAAGDNPSQEGTPGDATQRPGTPRDSVPSQPLLTQPDPTQPGEGEGNAPAEVAPPPAHEADEQPTAGEVIDYQPSRKKPHVESTLGNLEGDTDLTPGASPPSDPAGGSRTGDLVAVGVRSGLAEVIEQGEGPNPVGGATTDDKPVRYTGSAPSGGDQPGGGPGSNPGAGAKPKKWDLEVDQLFGFWLDCKQGWCQTLGRQFRRSKMKETDRDAIVRALEAGHDRDEIDLALRHVANHSWLMGKTSGKKAPSLDLTTILMIRGRPKPIDRVQELIDLDRPDGADSNGGRPQRSGSGSQGRIGKAMDEQAREELF